MGRNRSWEEHVTDTLIAGAGLCRREVVEHVAKHAKQRVEELIDLGVNFDRDSQNEEKYSLHREVVIHNVGFFTQRI